MPTSIFAEETTIYDDGYRKIVESYESGKKSINFYILMVNLTTSLNYTLAEF